MEFFRFFISRFLNYCYVEIQYTVINKFFYIKMEIVLDIPVLSVHRNVHSPDAIYAITQRGVLASVVYSMSCYIPYVNVSMHNDISLMYIILDSGPYICMYLCIIIVKYVETLYCTT